MYIGIEPEDLHKLSVLINRYRTSFDNKLTDDERKLLRRIERMFNRELRDYYKKER